MWGTGLARRESNLKKTSKNTTKSGTAILARATIAPRPGDGQIWAKPDGKALAVALTIGDRPVYLLAVHLPHTDAERIQVYSIII